MSPRHPLTLAIIGYRTGKRDGATTDDFIQDLRQRVIGVPEISTDGLHYYKTAPVLVHCGGAE